MANRFKRLCVFCGSSKGAKTVYIETAAKLGRALVARGIGLVYGGAQIGVMGAIADAVLNAGGEVIGVIPETLMRKEVAHERLTDLRVVTTMHERKAMMADLSDGFIALPGGCGTFEELFEVITWAQIGIHNKPCGLLNIAGYYDPLIALFEHGVSERFIHEQHRRLLITDVEIDALLDSMEAFESMPVEKWVDI